MLEVKGLAAAYGSSQVLFGADLRLEKGRVLGLLGRNGMGKTSLIKSLFGLTRHLGGDVLFEGKSLVGEPSFLVARRGIGLVPEGRQIFANLDVEENLIATGHHLAGGWTLARVFDLFPRLAERKHHGGHQLSGGEQQMLAIGRALMTNPKLLILDEATEGLAPAVRADIWRCLEMLKAQGQTILIVDPGLDRLMEMIDAAVVLDNGRTVWRGDRKALQAEAAKVRGYLTA